MERWRNQVMNCVHITYLSEISRKYCRKKNSSSVMEVLSTFWSRWWWIVLDTHETCSTTLFAVSVGNETLPLKGNKALFSSRPLVNGRSVSSYSLSPQMSKYILLIKDWKKNWEPATMCPAKFWNYFHFDLRKKNIITKKNLQGGWSIW